MLLQPLREQHQQDAPSPTFLFFLKQLCFIFTLSLGLEGKLSLPTSYSLLSVRKEMWLLDADPQEAERQHFAADGPGTKGGCVWPLSISVLSIYGSLPHPTVEFELH